MGRLVIARLGNPVLRKHSKAVTLTELHSKEFQAFLDQLIQTCDANDGVGVAAPQVSVNKRVIVVHVDPKNPRYKNKEMFPTTIIINPKVLDKSKQLKDDWEGDLSCGLRALVPRPISCKIGGRDRNGSLICYNLTNDFHARVFMHEIDHLNGVFLLDRVTQKQSICEVDEWKKHWKAI